MNKLEEFKRKCLEYIDSKTMRDYLNGMEDLQFSLKELMSIVYNSHRSIKEKVQFYKELENNFELNDEECEHIKRLVSTYEEAWKYIDESHKNIVYVLKITQEYESVFDTYKCAKKYYDDNLKSEYDAIKDCGPISYELEEVNTLTNESLASYILDENFNWIYYEFNNYKVHKNISNTMFIYNEEENKMIENKEYNKYPENLYVYLPSPFKIGDIVRDVYSNIEYVVVNSELPSGRLAEFSDSYDMCITVVPVKYRHLAIEEYLSKREEKYNDGIFAEEVGELDEISLYHEHLRVVDLELVKDIRSEN